MDSDEDFQDEGKPSTSSGKGPPPIKKPKPLTAAEKKRISRAKQSAEQKREELLKNQRRIGNKRESQSAEQKREELQKNQKKIAGKRASQSAVEKMQLM